MAEAMVEDSVTASQPDPRCLPVSRSLDFDVRHRDPCSADVAAQRFESVGEERHDLRKRVSNLLVRREG